MEPLRIHSQFGDYDVELSSIVDFQLNNQIPVIDENVWDLYKEKGFFKSIQNPIIIDVNEEKKSLESIENLAKYLLERNLGSDTHLLAIGGGITQELVSFLASIYFRGVKWSFLPTTLLSQADSCIGGKNSINVQKYKNMLGTFYPPVKVTIMSEFLSTLDQEALVSGKMEMLKIHFLSGREEFEKIVQFNDEELLRNSLRLKKRIVEADEVDSGLRWKLNLGHNFGHALETATKQPLAHGVAVGHGMRMGLRLSLSEKALSEENFRKLDSILEEALNDHMLPEYDTQKFHEALLRDKKNTNEELQFILCTGIGEVGVFRFPKSSCEKLINAALSLRL